MTRRPRIQPEESKMNPAENKQPEEIKMDPAENKPEPATDPVTPIKKPGSFSLDKFMSKHPANLPGVRTLLGPLPHYPIVDAKDFVRLHSDKAYWSPELCFVNVPIVGVKKDTIHLIDEALALKYLPPGRSCGMPWCWLRNRMTFSSWRTSRPSISTTPGTNSI